MAGMWLTERDRALIGGIYTFDGVMAERHARALLFPTVGDRTWWDRLKKLVDNRYLARPSREERYQRAVPEPVIWLDVLGIQYIVQQRGVAISDTLWRDGLEKANGKKQLQSALRKEGIWYKAEPDWLHLAHHIRVCDVRLMVQEAAEHAGLRFHRWINEGAFKANPDKVVVRYRTDKGEVREEREVIPDGFCVVSRTPQEAFAYLIEVDMRTQEQPRILYRHVRPYAAYLESAAYRQRVGLRYGRILFITTGPTRVRNLKRATEQVLRRRYFYFAPFDILTPQNFFAEPVWVLNGREEPLSLLEPAGDLRR